MFAKPLLKLAAAALFVLTSGMTQEVVAAAAGEVEFVRGAGSLQRPGRPAQLLGRGQQVEQGDTITTGPNSSAILKLTDGTRMTMRADSKFVLQTYDFKPAAPANESAGSMVIGLLKGGMRTLTGLIPKRDTDAARVITATATVGIRGTDFDARLCGNDCPRIAGAAPARPVTLAASARIISMQGAVTATDAAGSRRLLAVGGPIYPGDTLESAAGAHAVLAFRDDSRMTVQPSARVKIEDYVYDAANPGEGRLLLNLIKGGMRAFTGLIGKANRNNVTYRTPTATVGIRGTGTDLCVGCGTDENETAVSNWEGSITLTANRETCSGASCTIEINAGENAVVNGQGTSVVRSSFVLQFTTPRPDQVTPPANLWSVAAPPENTEGLFVFVRDGHISITTATEVLNLGKNEAAFSGGVLLRLNALPDLLVRGFNSGIVDTLAARSGLQMCLR